jgi:hypothetical protein
MVMGGDGTDYRSRCPYNKRLALKTFESIDRLVGALCALVENLGVASGVELKRSQGLSDIWKGNAARTECPMERMKQEPAVGGYGSSVGGKGRGE